MRIRVAGDIAPSDDDARISVALLAFVCRYRAAPDLFQSLAVVFEDIGGLCEDAFDAKLRLRLQPLSDWDSSRGQRYSSRVRSDPDDPRFSFSLAGEAFFLVGLHPGTSRRARRFEALVLVCNVHDPFERLRQEGRYETPRASILQRDEALAGSINLMLARHGRTSDAHRCSGRAVAEDWSWPFRRLAGVSNIVARPSNRLVAMEGQFDLIVSNPPFVLDAGGRTYRHGGGPPGAGLSMALLEGADPFPEAALARCREAGLDAAYRKFDPDAYGEKLDDPAYVQAERLAPVVLTAARPA